MYHQPFTSQFPRADIHELLAPDLLHQIIKGTFKDHLVTWAVEYVTAANGNSEAKEILADIDRRIATAPPFPALRRFPEGRGFKQWTGDDSKALMKVLLPAIVGHVPPKMVHAISAFMEFCYLVRRSQIDEDTLAAIDDAVSRFHTEREVFIEEDIREDFSLPRQHSLAHYHDLIILFGAPNGVCSSITESKHIKAVKEPWRRSSRNKPLGQMLLTNQRLDKLAASRVDFEARGMLDKQWAAAAPDARPSQATTPLLQDTNNDDAEDVAGLISLGDVKLARHNVTSYPRTLTALASYIGEPKLQEFVQRFLYDQRYPDAIVCGMEAPIAACPRVLPTLHVKVFHSASATYFAPSDLSGIGAPAPAPAPITKAVQFRPCFAPSSPESNVFYKFSQAVASNLDDFQVFRVDIRFLAESPRTRLTLVSAPLLSSAPARPQSRPLASPTTWSVATASPIFAYLSGRQSVRPPLRQDHIDDATDDSAAKTNASSPAKADISAAKTNASGPAKADISAAKTNVGTPAKADIGATTKTNVDPAEADIDPAKATSPPPTKANVTAPTKANITAPTNANVTAPTKADIEAAAKPHFTIHQPIRQLVTYGVILRSGGTQAAPALSRPGSLHVTPIHGATPVTHILAVQSSPSSKHPAPDTIFLVPTYHIVLAANCAHIPRIPVSRPQMRSNGMLAVPVMPLVVPHTEAFTPLHAFLVAHRLDRLMSALLPVPPSMLAGARPGTSAPPAPLPTSPHPSAIWRNACALGIFDRDLWAALDFSWEVILGAMNMVTTGAV
ncbi:hypothetical protein BC826DRAFT_1109838 [Russula brevipes]|nr:hypothetical protein BC826DRAFT_1109838 [Russula brevipes]